MTINPDNLRSKANAGFSLVDVMVGMVIALLGVVIIFQVFSVSEGIKRTTISGGEASQNGTSALFTLEQKLKMAGYGIFASTNIFPFPADSANTPKIVITPGAIAKDSDSMLLRYRQYWDYGPFPPSPLAFPSAVPPALTLETISVNPQAQLAFSDVPDPNPGVPPYNTITLAAAAAAIGAAPPSANGVISDGIVLMKAEYGYDANSNGKIDAGEWIQQLPLTPILQNILALRIALVARSAQPEKPSIAGGACDTTIVFPTWIDSAAVPLDLSGKVGLAAGDDWKCYRYKTFETTVSLRN